MDHWLLVILLLPRCSQHCVQALISCWDYYSRLLTRWPAFSLFFHSILLYSVMEWSFWNRSNGVLFPVEKFHWLFSSTGWSASILYVLTPACLFSLTSCSFHVFFSFLARLRDLYFPECAVLFSLPGFCTRVLPLKNAHSGMFSPRFLSG